MGIGRLMQLLKEKAPGSIKKVNLSNFTGQVFALDASMSMYQFLISTQQIKTGFSIAELKDEQGNLTGHLLGLYNRTIFLMEHGIKPVWVFDGKPPEAKRNTLRGRKKRKEDAAKNEEEAKDEGDMEKALKFANQTVRITEQMTNDAKKLIKLLGIPMIEAPSEAEASCSILCKNKKVNAAATEDMDSLCFGCPLLIRDLSSKEEEVVTVNLEIALKELDVTMDEFIDVCILCGCDYCSKIEGIGSVNALKLIKERKNIEGVIKFSEEFNKDPSHKKKLTYDNETFDFVEARRLFKEPEVCDCDKVKFEWTKPKAEELKEFLVKEKNFNETRIDNLLKRIENAKSKSSQTRMESFFVPLPTKSMAPGTGKLKAGERPGDKKDKKANTTKKGKKAK